MGNLNTSRAILALACVFIPYTLFAQTSPVADQTAVLQQQIDALPLNGTLDCLGGSYPVTSLHLKSDMTIQNCDLQTVAGAVDDVAPITIDGRGQALSNIVVRNVNVTGDRHEQTNIGYSGQEDGGRHCFRLLGKLSNIVIEGSSGSYCASDGLAMVSYGVATSDNTNDLAFQHVVVRNSTFSFNRRQGVSVDSANDLTFDNVVFLNNGNTVPGGEEGDQCAADNGSCYGTGFWYEDYQTDQSGEGLNSVVFSRCTFRGNFQRSLFFFTRGNPAAQGYQPRGNIRILNSYLDAGAQPLTEDYALQFQVDNSLVGGQTAVFQGISVQNTSLDGSIGFRQVSNVSFRGSQIDSTIPYLGYSAYSTDIGFTGVKPATKQLAASMTPNGQNNPVITYSEGSMYQSIALSPPQAGRNVKGDIVWNSQTGGSNGWICLAGGSPCGQWQSF